MCRVRFQPLAPRRQRPLRRRDKFVLHTGDFLQAHRARNLGQVTAKGHALGAMTGQPPSSSARWAPPSHGRAAEALRPACAILNPRHRPCSFRKRLMRATGSTCLSPDAGITGGDPAFRRNRAGFGHDQTRAAHRPRTQMHQVPVRGRAVHRENTRTWATLRCRCAGFRFDGHRLKEIRRLFEIVLILGDHNAAFGRVKPKLKL